MAMTDIVDPLTRSRIMASVKTRDTRLELAVQRALRTSGYRIRVNATELPGSPDVVVPELRAVVLVHGCFWHRHGCDRTTTPRSRRSYWQRKFEENVRRDRRNRRRLRRMGWRTFTVWECKREHDIERIKRALTNLRIEAEETASPSGS
jgi:DNA mismatch endonuclease (patch repair protein)